MNTALQVFEGELSVITTPPPRVQAPTDVIVKVAYSGICGTDLHVLAKEFPCAKSVVLGHEFSGVVTEIGSDVKHCSVGERSEGNEIYCSIFQHVTVLIDSQTGKFKNCIPEIYKMS